MPIVHVYPEPEEAHRMGVPLFVDSNAEDNIRAIREIERWCREQGLARAQESHLRTLRTEHGLVRRGICYRPPPAEYEQRELEWAEVLRRRESMPETVPTDDGPESG